MSGRHGRTAGRGVRPLRAATAAVLGVLLLALAACAGVPTSSTPQAVSTVERIDGVADAPEPEAGREPDLLLRDFVKASSEPGGRHSAARRFLSEDAARGWDAETSVSLVDKIDVFFEDRTDNSASLLLRAAKVGDLDEMGVFRAEEGTLETRITMVRRGDLWVIDQLPDGVIIDRSQFFNSYQQVSLFYLDPDAATLVADQRWLSLRSDQLAAELIDLLIAGPRPTLRDAVRTELGPDVHLRSTLTRLDGRDSESGFGFGGLRMDFQGIGGLAPQNRERLVAQLVWTLSSAGVAGPYEILSDGAPLMPGRDDPWTAEELTGFLPGPVGDGPELLALRHGRVHQLDEDSGPGGVVWPDTQDLESGTLSRDGQTMAAVRAGDPGTRPAQLLVGPVQSGAAPEMVLEADSLTVPTWSVGRDALWVVADEERLLRLERGADGTWHTEEVDSRAVRDLGGPVTALRMSWDGVRMAMIVGGRVYVTAAVQDDDGAHRLTAPRAIAFSLGDAAVALDWAGAESLVVLREPGEIAVTMVDPEGFEVRSVTSRNLFEPVTRIGMVGQTAYVVDGRGVTRLRLPSGGGEEPFWRDVPGLGGEDTAVITRG